MTISSCWADSPPPRHRLPEEEKDEGCLNRSRAEVLALRSSVLHSQRRLRPLFHFLPPLKEIAHSKFNFCPFATRHLLTGPGDVF